MELLIAWSQRYDRDRPLPLRDLLSVCGSYPPQVIHGTAYPEWCPSVQRQSATAPDFRLPFAAVAGAAQYPATTFNAKATFRQSVVSLLLLHSDLLFSKFSGWLVSHNATMASPYVTRMSKISERHLLPHWRKLLCAASLLVTGRTRVHSWCATSAGNIKRVRLYFRPVNSPLVVAYCSAISSSVSCRDIWNTAPYSVAPLSKKR